MSGRLGPKVRIWYVASERFEKDDKLIASAYVLLDPHDISRSAHYRDGRLWFGRAGDGAIPALIYTTDIYEYFLGEPVTWTSSRKLLRPAGPWTQVPDEEVLLLIVEGRLHRG